jgi:hypothetical protein
MRKQYPIKFLSFFLLSFCLLSGAKAQNVTGYWYGSANVILEGKHNNYMIELVLNQKGNDVKGIFNYYFANRYRSQQVTGFYNVSTRQLSFSNIPLPYFQSNSKYEVDCYMDFSTLHRVSQVGAFLNGRFTSIPAYRNTCPEIAINMKMNTEVGNIDSVVRAIKEFKEVNQVWTPSTEDTVVAVTLQPLKVTNYVINDAYRQRENVVSDEIEVDSDSIKVDFYDNGDVDGDSIAIFLNSKLMAYHQKLSTKSISFAVPLDTLQKVNEISMFAENLGSIPPNTALMVVTAGEQRFEIRMSSSLEKNAVVRIKRKKKGLKVR